MTTLNNQNRTFGVEFEAYNIDRNLLAAKLREAGINATVEYYNHETRNYWKVITDGSINGENGFELVSPVLSGEDGLEQVRTVCAVMTSLGAKVNKSCGMHVHIGANDLTLDNFKNIFKHYAKFEDVYDSVMPESRRASNNIFCKSVLQNFANIADFFNKVDECLDVNQLYSKIQANSRYYKLNLDSYFRHGTLEFRHHSGTTEADKAVNWITYCVNFTEFAKDRKGLKVDAASDMAKRTGYVFGKFGAELIKFYRNRQKQLAAA